MRKNATKLFIYVLLLVVVFAGCKIEFPEDVEVEALPTVAQEEIVEITPSSIPDKKPSEKKDKKSHKVTPTPKPTKKPVKKSNDNKPTVTPAPTVKVVVTPTAKPTVTPKPTKKATNQLVCAMSITCHKILENRDLFDDSKKAFLPSNGVMLKRTKFVFYNGETVFDVLKRVSKSKEYVKKIPITHRGGTYIETINHIGEFDCGPASGWVFKVNGVKSDKGCNEYKVKNGDIIEWIYTCDVGNDIN